MSYRFYRKETVMVTHYVEDFAGKRAADAVDPTPAEVPATPVQGDPEEEQVVTAKVVAAPAKATPKKSAAKVETKG